MIILGIVFIIIGALFYASGNNINNDIDAQMESFFNDGVTNPGSNYETLGLVFVLLGIIFVVIGLVKKASENNASNSIPSQQVKQEIPRYESVKKSCTYCGTTIDKESKFCSKCGRENSNYIDCPVCNQRLAAGSLFCNVCGADIMLHKFSLQDSPVENIVSAAFENIQKADFITATALLDSAEKKEPTNTQISLGRLFVNYKLTNEEMLAYLKKAFWKNENFAKIMASNDEELKSRLLLYKNYASACLAIDREYYDEALNLLNQLNGWKDSAKKIEHCKEMLVKEKRSHIASIIGAVIAAIIFISFIILALSMA